jgi:erythromycin esterase-like protein
VTRGHVIIAGPRTSASIPAFANEDRTSCQIRSEKAEERREHNERFAVCHWFARDEEILRLVTWLTAANAQQASIGNETAMFRSILYID